MAFIRHLKNRAMSKYGYDDTRQTRFRRLLLGMGVAMLLFFLLLKIFFAEQLPFTSLHWKLIFGYFLLLSVAVLVYPVFRKMRDQDRWSIQNGAIEIEEGVLHLSVVRGRETRRLNVEIKNLKIVTSDDVRIRIDTPVGQLTISADKFVTPEEYASFQAELIGAGRQRERHRYRRRDQVRRQRHARGTRELPGFG